MTRKAILLALSLTTIAFVILTAQRLSMNYNENDVYYDGEVTYNTDAPLAYGVIACFFLITTVGTALIWKAKNSRQNN